MECSHKNLIVNGDFRTRIAPWTGRLIRRVKNPQNPKDESILMGGKDGNQRSILSQLIEVQPEFQCAYYLTFRMINISPKDKPAQFYATVAYLDAQSRLIRSTPLWIKPPKQQTFRAYFTIVPPPPKQTSKIKIVFLLTQGILLIDTVRLASRNV